MAVVDINIVKSSDPTTCQIVQFNIHVFIEMRQQKCRNKLQDLNFYNCTLNLCNWNVRTPAFFVSPDIIVLCVWFAVSANNFSLHVFSQVFFIINKQCVCVR